MELIKLLCLLTLGFFIRQFSFLIVISTFWIINMFIGVYLNKDYFKESESFVNYIIYQTILFGEWIYQKLSNFGNTFFNSSNGQKIYNYTKTIDKMYLDGRSFLFQKFKQNALKNLPMYPPPMMPVFPRLNRPIRNNNLVLNKSDDINNFLDDIIQDKKEN